jgi:hypothetical protein
MWYAFAEFIDKRDSRWEIALASHNVQLLAVSSFRSGVGVDAIEVDGNLEVLEESLGFGTYSAVDRSLRFPRFSKFPAGTIQINDPSGSLSLWSVTRDENFTWVTKNIGVPDIPHDARVQVVRTVDGRFSLRRPIA